jgi:hypothetical protein
MHPSPFPNDHHRVMRIFLTRGYKSSKEFEMLLKMDKLNEAALIVVSVFLWGSPEGKY